MGLSNAPAAKRALYDALHAELSSDQVGVWHSDPNTDHQPNDNVVVAPSDRPMTFSQQWVGLGGNAGREEEITIPVLIEVFKGGTDAFAAEERAWELAASVATVLHARPFEDNIFEARPESGEHIAGETNDGRVARLTLNVHCTGRVYGI